MSLRDGVATAGYCLLGLLGYVMVASNGNQPTTIVSMLAFAGYYLLYGGGAWLLAKRMGYSDGICQASAWAAGVLLLAAMIRRYL